MTDLSQKLLDLHIQHELDNFSDEQFQTDLRLELDQFFEQLADRKLQEFISAEQVIAWAQSHILELKLHNNVGTVVEEIVSDLFLHNSHEENGLATLMSDSQVEAYVDKALSQVELRKALIHQGMDNEIVHEVIAELLYSGISSYLTESNIVAQKAQKVPGVKGMMKMSKGIMNKAAPKLEEKIETQVKKYIGIALPDVIAQSEDFIHESITDAHIKEIAMGIWHSAKTQAVSTARDYISVDDAKDYTQLSYQQFLSSRQSDYIAELVSAGIHSFFKHYGNKKLSALCKDFAIDADSLENEVMLFAPQILQLIRDSGYLEQRIRARLERFYHSSAAQEALS